MRLYNTLTRETEDLNCNSEVLIYTCGPTVYNYIHIGNARPICVFDVLRRYLKYCGLKVKYVLNFTDVDDKIINKSNEEGVSAKELSDKYINEYFTDARGLNVLDADVHPRVSENMDTIINLITKIKDNGFAYQSGNDVFFSVRKFNEYGKLSGKNIDDLQSGARVSVNENKENPLDFAIWKGAKENEPSWDSPWGKGRPGWHIECSAMSMKYLGETIDIHCGGADLIFPHHENEIAQSEAATGKPFSRFWLHNGFIDIDNVKMSKSKGNFFLVRDVAKEYGYEVIRYMMIQSHYASPINYTTDVLNAAKSSLDRLYQCRENLEKALKTAVDTNDYADENYTEICKFSNNFKSAMDDNLNTSLALGTLFDLVRFANTLANNPDSPKKSLESVLGVFNEITDVLGLLYERKEESIPQEISELVEQWETARKAKDFSLADELKAKISTLGYKVEVTRQGTNIKKNN
ncbi:MAG: cysteine--tRNA ligase [Oscillospiraceae bacterium]|jgi:cysteinyl-tRNA synthetase|nr:cysteine--tRNA ligase [Oscillospiraceae bacterium]